MPSPPVNSDFPGYLRRTTPKAVACGLVASEGELRLTIERICWTYADGDRPDAPLATIFARAARAGDADARVLRGLG